MDIKSVFFTIKNYKIVSVFIFIGIISIAGFWTFLSSDTNQLYSVKQGSIVSTVLATGTYATASQTRVTSPTNGVISELFVSDNQTVKKGDSLFRVESTATESQKRTALAAYLAAKSALDADTATAYSLQSAMYSKWKSYFDLATNSTYENSDKTPKSENRILTEFTTVQDNWLAAEAAYKNQQGVIEKDRAALLAAKQTYDETQSVTVTAPIEGTVINLSAKINDQISAPIQPGSGIPVLIIADFNNPSLIATVDQVNIPYLKLGQKASIIFDALPDQVVEGTLTYIDIAGTKTQGTTNFTVRVLADNLPPEVQLNMTATITIITAQKSNILTVPNDTIIQKNGKTFVQLPNKKLKEITVGIKGLTDTEIVRGLLAGDRVVIQQ